MNYSFPYNNDEETKSIFKIEGFRLFQPRFKAEKAKFSGENSLFLVEQGEVIAFSGAAVSAEIHYASLTAEY